MMRNTSNACLNVARHAKNDEFYTQYCDIEAELRFYHDKFRGQVVYCNCDDLNISNFWKYFNDNFDVLGLKSLISSCYCSGSLSHCWVRDGSGSRQYNLHSDGDFKSSACLELLKVSDIVVTNPPFSQFRDFVDTLMWYDKKFLIIGSMNAITCQNIFGYLKSNQMWLGRTSPKKFILPDGSLKSFGNILWYTNLDISKRHAMLDLSCTFSDNIDKYSRYVNYDAININRVSDIPVDYFGAMGVPITFLNKHCPEQFEILGLGIANQGLAAGVQPYLPEHRVYRMQVEHKGAVDGDLYILDEYGHPKVPYARILIRRL